MILNPFRFQLGDVVYVRADIAAEYQVTPDTQCEVVSLTLNARGTFANCTYRGGKRRITIDERGLVRTNAPVVAHITVPA